MTDLTGYDAAYPPTDPPPDQVVFGYLGGDTPNPWTAGEWASQRARYRVGIWTRSDPTGAAQGTAEGRAAAAAWRALGAPAGTLIVLDLESAVCGPYVVAFDAEATADGLKVAAYGSLSTLFKNPRPSGGYFPADITGKPHLYSGTELTQFEFQTGWDDDEVSGSLIGSLWDTRPTPPAPPAPATSQEDEDMNVTSNGGRAGLQWAGGTRGIIQVGYDPAGGDPTLRTVLVMPTGPWVAPEWKPTKGSGDYEIPANLRPDCRGVIVTLAEGSPNVTFDLTAV